MEEQVEKEKIYCIFDNAKEELNAKIEKAFKIYIKEQMLKENKDTV